MKKFLFSILFAISLVNSVHAAPPLHIFAAQTANGASLAFNAIGTVAAGSYQETLLTIFGTFNGAGVQLQYKASDGTYYATNDPAFTASGAYFAKINPNIPYRLLLTSAGGSTNISADVYNASLVQ